MTIVAFGTYDAAKHPRAGIVIDGLREHGHEVLEINRPLGFSTAERVRMLQQPWRLPALAWRLLRCWLALWREARALRRRAGEPDAVLVGYLGHFDVLLARRAFPRSTIVLDHLVFAGDTARDRGAEGWRVRLLRGLDARALAAADIVLVDTAEHGALLPEGVEGIHVPVGARAEWFDARESRDDAAGSALSLVFFGLFTPLQGAPVIARALRLAQEAGARFIATIVGTGQDHAQARAEAGDIDGVTWIDWVEPGALPALVARHDVCLGVFGTSDKARRVVPNKVYEGAAAGCAVLTSDTPPQRAAFDGGALFTAAGDPEELAAAIVALAEDPGRRAELRALATSASERFRARSVVTPLALRLHEAR
ncbi:glycosyltransferase [Microbacterium betulae]|uniref:Glycosyltransferase n=1 Tax=Microbacterium betulae TaxID=2981139 RepID=A0AA97FJL6_9MICO|nr:glycosyltransferase [Microbacterium sp. AB]WOF24178.1 glycosyltransferase [Microbacterium sp. AB]